MRQVISRTCSTTWGPDNLAANVVFVSGILGIFFFEFLMPQVVAIVTGLAGLVMYIEERKRGGRGAATAGFILGIIYIIVAIEVSLR